LIASETEDHLSSSYIRNYTGLTFDKTVRFLFCTDAQGIVVASCSVQFLAIDNQFVQYNPIARNGIEYLGGVDRKLLEF